MKSIYSVLATALLFTVAACEMPPGTGATTRPGSRLVTTTAPAARATTTQKATAPPSILEPTQGRPVILRPGDRFYFLLRTSNGFSGDVYISLVHSLAPEISFEFPQAEQIQTHPGQNVSMVLQIPKFVSEGLYNIQVNTGSSTLISRHCIKIVPEFRTKFRFVHLSDMNIGDPTAPDFDRRLIDEINLLAPEFIIATGNFFDPTAKETGPVAWQRTLDFLAQFQSPVYVLCGRNDDDKSFSPTVATSPIGLFAYGDYQGILLFDTPAQPMDAGQIEFIRRQLAEGKDTTFNFLAANDDNPAALMRMAQKDPVADFLRANRIRLMLCGGSSDWDGHEYADTLARLPGLHYVRTHPASTCRTGLATGESRYRVIEVNGEELTYVYPVDQPRGQTQDSIPVGKLGMSGYDIKTAPGNSVAIQIRNGLNQPFADCRLWFKLAKNGEAKPQIAGALMLQSLNARGYWLCQARVDLPDRGGLQVLASLDSDLPAPPPLTIDIASPGTMTLKPARSQTGLAYYESSDAITINLKNRSSDTLSLRPVVRLQGTTLTLAEGNPPAWPITIAPNQTVALSYKVLLPNLVEGVHYAQVTFLEDPLRRLQMHRIELRKAEPLTTTQAAR